MFTTAKEIHAGDKELQDRAEFFWLDSKLVLVLADGAGGLGGGAEAAEFIVRGVSERIGPTVLNPQGLVGLLTSLDRDMANAGDNGESTAVVAVLSKSDIIGASVGDSGAFIISKTGAENLTANQIRKPFVGSGCAVPVSFARGPLEGTLLIASDGLLKYTSLEKIAAATLAADLNDAATRLVALVRYQSGALPDDVAILLSRRA